MLLKVLLKVVIILDSRIVYLLTAALKDMPCSPNTSQTILCSGLNRSSVIAGQEYSHYTGFHVKISVHDWNRPKCFEKVALLIKKTKLPIKNNRWFSA